MRILLTGASGFLGSHIAEQLDQQGADVRALVRPTSDTGFLEGLQHVTLMRGALSDRGSLLAATEGVDGIIHAAGLVKARRPADFYRTNELGTANLLDAAKANAPEIKVLLQPNSSDSGFRKMPSMVLKKAIWENISAAEVPTITQP